VNLPVTNIPRCVCCSVKALGLQHLQLLDMDAGSGPLDQACIVHCRTDELLIKQYVVSDG
jgi:hypothetical protein